MSANSASSVSKTQELEKHSPVRDFALRFVREKPLGTVGGFIVLIMFITGIFAHFLAPHGMNDVNLQNTLAPPSVQYPLGTDQMGRDVLSRIIYGAQISMIVGIAGAALDVLMAVGIGVVSGFFGNRVDIIVQRFVDAWMCFPWLFIILTIMALLGPGLWQIIVVLGLAAGIQSSRVVRSTVIAIKENIYIEAARTIGCSTRRMLIRHILPNIMAPVITIFTLSMARMILSEATVSFLGFGIPPPFPSWGGMLSQEGRDYMYLAPWLAIWPGLALGIAVYGINMLGDAMRDLLDPRLRGGAGRYGRRLAKRRAGPLHSQSGILAPPNNEQ